LDTCSDASLPFEKAMSMDPDKDRLWRTAL
jgi:hypothetical protein